MGKGDISKVLGLKLGGFQGECYKVGHRLELGRAWNRIALGWWVEGGKSLEANVDEQAVGLGKWACFLEPGAALFLLIPVLFRTGRRKHVDLSFTTNIC